MKAKVPLEDGVGPSDKGKPRAAACLANSSMLSTSKARCVRSLQKVTGPLAGFLYEMEWRPGGHQVKVVLAELGEWAGTYGAAWQVSR